MVFLVIRLISLLFIIFIIYAAATQVILPVITGTNLFPYFRKSYRNAEERLKQIRTEKHDSALMEEAVKEEIEMVNKTINQSNDLINEINENTKSRKD